MPLGRSAIDLDHHSSTPLFPEARHALEQGYNGVHALERGPRGDAARASIARARERVRGRVGALDHAVVFTSGATESNALALGGILKNGGHAVSVVTEHPSVLAVLRASGASVTLVPVDSDGRVDIDDIRGAVRPDTRVVSVMAVNNEIGAVADLPSISALCRDLGVPLHTDASQLAFARLDAGPDLITLSAHKIGGPPGIGALLIRRGLALAPTVEGGGQQEGLRGGTLPVGLIAAMGEAAFRVEDPAAIGRLRDALADGLEAGGVEFTWNGNRGRRAPHNLHISLPGVDTQLLRDQVADRLICSVGSACRSGSPAPSHVMRAIGLRGRALGSVLRLGLGWTTSARDVERAAGLLSDAILRQHGVRGAPWRL